VRANRTARGRESGAVLPEVALSAALFFFLLLGGFELCRGAFVYAGLKMGVVRAARTAAVGVGPTVNDVRAFLEQYARTPVTDFKLCGYSAAPCTVNVRGQAGQWMQLGASTSVRLFGLYALDISATTVFRHEQNFRTFAPTS